MAADDGRRVMHPHAHQTRYDWSPRGPNEAEARNCGEAVAGRVGV